MNGNAKGKLNLGRQTAISTTGLTIQFFAQWIISVLLVRMSDYRNAGIFSLAMTVSNVFAYFGNYGMRSYLITDIKKQFSEWQYFNARLSATLFSVFCCVIYLFSATGYSRDEAIAVFLYLLYNSVNNISDIMQGDIQLKGHLEVTGISDALRGILCLVTFLAVFSYTKKITIALGFMVLATMMVTAAYDLPVYKRFLSIKATPKTAYRENVPAIVSILIICFPLMISQIIPIITTAIPRRAIQLNLGEEMLGIYSSIFAPTAIVLTLIPAVVTAVLPRIAEAWSEPNKKKFKRALYIGILVILALLIIACAAVSIIGKWGLRLLFGDSILDFFPLLYWAVLIAVINASTAFFNGLLTTMRSTKTIAFFSLIPLFLMLVFCNKTVIKGGVYTIAKIQMTAYSVQVALQILFILIRLSREIIYEPFNSLRQ